MSASAGAVANATRTRAAARDEAYGEPNVNEIERIASVIAGGALAAYALKRKDVAGLIAGVFGGFLVERGITGHCAVYGTLGMRSKDTVPVQRHGANAVLDASVAQRVDRAVTVYGKMPAELFAFWRDFENLPRIMQHLESVEVLDDRRSRWIAKAPAGRTVEWDAEVFNEVPNELIAWRSLHDADVKNAGSVRFREAPGGRGTEVHVVLEYAPPAGRLGAAVARLLGEEPDAQVREDLRRFKQLMESGELAVSEIPGQGARAAGSEFNVTASNDPRVQSSAPERAAPHEPRHVPPPADAARGTTSSQDAEVAR